MPDREKVIKGLEQFISDFKPYCGNEADWGRVFDAVTLLEEDRPKVLTLKEAASCDACWFETNPNVHIDYWPYNSEINKYVLRDKDMDDDGDIVYYGNVKWYIRVLPKYYNVRWRCWDREPSKEEKEAIKWEDGKNAK